MAAGGGTVAGEVAGDVAGLGTVNFRVAGSKTSFCLFARYQLMNS